MSLIVKMGKAIGKMAYEKIIHNAKCKEALLEASPIISENLVLGDMVQSDNIVGVLIEQNNNVRKMISLVQYADVWFYQYGYSPYLGEYGTSWNISTNAIDEWNGEGNCKLLSREEQIANDAVSSADKKKFPLLEKCYELGDNWYVPAVKELECFLSDTNLNASIRCYLHKLLLLNTDENNTCTFWTSTDVDEHSAMALSWNMKTNKMQYVKEFKNRRYPFFVICSLYT